MKCSNCGNEVAEGTGVCPYCSAVIQATEENEAMGTGSALLGKQYTLSSSIGANLLGVFNSKIINQVEIGEDRLYINTKPKRFEKSPAVLYQDIMGIVVSLKINFYFLFIIVVSAGLGFAYNPVWLIVTALHVWLGRDRKITIHQRSGVDVVMYCQTLKEAQEFVNDVQQMV